MGSEDFFNLPSESDEAEDEDDPAALQADAVFPAEDEVRQGRHTALAFTPETESLQESDFKDFGEIAKSPEDANRIIEQIKSVVLFGGCDSGELLLVANYMYKRAVVSGEVVIKFGDDGDAFYVVQNGTFRCTKPGEDGQDVELGVYQDKGCFGELALINLVPRAASVTAVTEGELWVLCAVRCNWLRKRQAVRNSSMCEHVINAIPTFRDNLDSGHVNRLIDAIEMVTVPAGEVICKQGEPGDAMYFILKGHVEALIDGKSVKLLRENEFFGERALILDEGRAATCQATEVTKLAKLPKESFELLIPDCVVDKMRAHIAATYGSTKVQASDSSSDIDDSDDSTSFGKVCMEYLCQETKS